MFWQKCLQLIVDSPWRYSQLETCMNFSYTTSEKYHKRLGWQCAFQYLISNSYVCTSSYPVDQYGVPPLGWMVQKWNRIIRKWKQCKVKYTLRSISFWLWSKWKSHNFGFFGKSFLPVFINHLSRLSFSGEKLCNDGITRSGGSLEVLVLELHSSIQQRTMMYTIYYFF